MDTNLIKKIEKAIFYAQDPDRITFSKFEVTFQGNQKCYKVVYNNGYWVCDCKFFQSRQICSHIMTLERILTGFVEPCQTMPVLV